MNVRRQDHPSELFTDYLCGRLAQHQAQAIRRHLKECRDCQQEILWVQTGMEAAASLHPVTAPPELWERLLKASTATSSSTAAAKEGPKNRYQSWIAAAALLLFCLNILVFWMVWRSPQADRSWSLESVQGVVRVNDTRETGSRKLASGSRVTTGGGSEARLGLDTIGELVLGPDSSLLIREHSREHVFVLEDGRLRASIWAPPGLVLVETPAALAVDLGCAYDIQYDQDRGEGLLTVTSGWVSLKRADREITVPAGMSCPIRESRGPGAPSLSDQRPEWRAAVSRLSFGLVRSEDVRLLLRETNSKNALTLFYVVSFLEESKERSLLLEKLSRWVAPPKAIADWKDLTQEEREKWRESIHQSVLGYGVDSAPSVDIGELQKLPPLNDPRAGHTATVLPNGRVLIAGGWADGKLPIASSELFLPDRSFHSGPALIQPRYDHSANLLADGRVLLIGGEGARGRLSSTEIYDPVKGLFEPGPDLRVARSSHRATRLADGRILITGGRDWTGFATAAAEVFDPVTWDFQSLDSMAEVREGHTATLLADGRVLIAGGQTPVVELFLPDENRFERLPDLAAAPRYKGGAAVLSDGRVLILGGSGESNRQVEIFSPQTNRLTPFLSLNLVRFKIADAVLTLPDDRVLIAGGHPRLEIFNPQKGQFEFLDFNLQRPHHYATATALGSHEILIVGGYSYDIEPTPDAWLLRLD